MQWALLSGLGLVWGAVLAWRIYIERRQPDAKRFAGDIGAGGILLLLNFAFFWRTLSGDVYQPADGGDLVSFLYPTYRYAASQISQWTLPLWNPHLYGGAPFIGDIQAGFLYLPNLLLFLINPGFTYETLQWLSIGHLYWAGLGMYVLLRTVRFGDESIMRPAALLGALAFQFSDALFIHLGNLNLIAVFSWLPWIFAAYWLALTRRNISWAIIASVLFAIANYAGHAQSSYYIGLALVVYTLIWLTLEIQGRAVHQASDEQQSWSRFIWERLRYLVVIGLLTLLLTAPILLPGYEMASYTDRQDYTYQDAIAFSLAPTQAIAGFFTPGFFGRGPQLYWSLWDRVETPYVGMVTLILALLGLVLAPRQVRKELWPWVGLSIFGLLVALGVYGIVHGLLFALLPGFDQFRAPARAIMLWAFAVSILGAVGVDVLARRWQDRKEPDNIETDQTHDRGVTVFMLVGSVVLVGIVVPILFWALLVTQGNDSDFLHASLAALSVVIAAGFWLATWAVLAGYRAGWFGSVLFGGLLDYL